LQKIAKNCKNCKKLQKNAKNCKELQRIAKIGGCLTQMVLVYAEIDQNIGFQ
jgi:hypothetical protein